MVEFSSENSEIKAHEIYTHLSTVYSVNNVMGMWQFHHTLAEELVAVITVCTRWIHSINFSYLIFGELIYYIAHTC